MIWGGLVAVIACIAGAFVLSRWTHSGGRAGGPLPVLRQVTEFTLTNQNGQALSLASLRGQVWVADLIFTRCAGPCVIMSRLMSELQADLPPGQPVKLVSLTADPDFDTPQVLKHYGERFKAEPARWQFLTGPRPELYRLATQDLMLVVVENKPEERTTPDDLFLHSTRFILVDQKGRIRGVYDSESSDAKSRVLDAVHRLLREG